MLRIKTAGGRKGFTVIELLIVVLVIGVLASAGMAKYQGFAETARSRTCMSNQSTIENAVAMWCMQNTALTDAGEGAQWWRKDGHSSSHGWSTPPPFSDTWNIAQVIRDNKVFVCPKTAQDFGSIENVPLGWCTGNNGGWCSNYIFYYTGPGVGGSWNGDLWFIQNAVASGVQITFCGAYGCWARNAPGFSTKYKHARMWN